MQEALEVLMHYSIRSVIRYVKEQNISASQMGALISLHQQGVRSVSDIGNDLGITSAAASQMLDRLVQQGLIARSEDPHDRRGKRIALTDIGRQVIREGFPIHQGWLNDLTQTLTPIEREQIGAALSILVEKAKRMDEPKGEM
jgi:DNA-binding MarR family transcriptional regulator